MPETNQTSWKRVVTTTGGMLSTLGIVGLAVAATVAGSSVLAARNGIEDGPPPAPATAVSPAKLRLQTSYAVERRFSGEIEAPQEANLSFEAGGSVDSIRVREGDAVTKGMILAELDTRLLELERARLVASRRALEADVELAKRTADRQAELRERGFATDQRVDDTSLRVARLEASLAEIDAALGGIDVQLSKARLVAPFDGRVAVRYLDEGTVAPAGAPVVSLVEDGPVRFRVGLSLDLLQDLGPGDQATVETALGSFTATLAHVAPTLDPATRTLDAFYTVAGAGLPARMTGDLLLSSVVAVDDPGAWVPLSALRQGPKGTWTILTAETEDDVTTAGLAAVEIIHLDTNRAFVRGTFTADTLILDEGTHRVVPGERLTIATAGEVLSWAR